MKKPLQVVVKSCMEDNREAHATHNNRLLNRLIQVGTRVLLNRWPEIQVRVYDENGNNVSAADSIDIPRGGEFMHMDCALHNLICWDSGVLSRMTVHIPADKMDNSKQLKSLFDETESINVEILSL